MIGQLNKYLLIRAAHMDLAGFVDGYKEATDKITGAYYRLYSGHFIATFQNTKSRGTRLALPAPADAWLYRLLDDGDTAQLFGLRIQIVPHKTHTLGYDWVCTPIDPACVMDTLEQFVKGDV